MVNTYIVAFTVIKTVPGGFRPLLGMLEIYADNRSDALEIAMNKIKSEHQESVTVMLWDAQSRTLHKY